MNVARNNVCHKHYAEVTSQSSVVIIHIIIYTVDVDLNVLHCNITLLPLRDKGQCFRFPDHRASNDLFIAFLWLYSNHKGLCGSRVSF